MKILHELNQLDIGGVEKVVRNIIKYDKENEHSILTYADGKYRGELEAVGAKIIMFEDQEMDLSADVVHIHTGGDYSRMAYEIDGSIPVVETIHSPVRSPVSYKHVTQRVGVSDAVSRINHECITVHNGIDFEIMEPTKTKEEMRKELDLPEGIPVIGRLGRLGYDKGLEEWIMACYLLQKEGYKFVPLIVGDAARGTKNYLGQLSLMAASLPLEGCIFIPGKNDVSNWLQIMDTFFYPSATEGFGLVFIEAMFNESLVVSYDTDVNKEIIGGYALLSAKKLGIKGLVEALKLSFNQDIRDSILGIQVEKVLQDYSAERMSLMYQEIYEQCNLNLNGTNKPKTTNVVFA